MREIPVSKASVLNQELKVLAVDERCKCGCNANHKYRIQTNTSLRSFFAIDIDFQDKPIQHPEDVNGVSNEALLAILIDRMEGFCSGEFNCKENEAALVHLECARDILEARTKDRVARNVEGKLEK